MQITEIWPEPWPGSSTVARFSVALQPDLKLVGLKLQRKDDGSYRVRSPNLAGQAAFHIGPDLARRITTAAVAALTGGRAPREFTRN